MPTRTYRKKAQCEIKIEGSLKLDFSDYEYMEWLDLEGWTWEFIRRSKAYKKIYSELKKKPTAEVISEKIDELRNLAIRPEILPSSSRSPDHFLKVQENYRPGEALWIPNPSIKYIEFPNFQTPNLIGTNPVAFIEINNRHLIDGHVPPDISYNIINNYIVRGSPRNTIYVGIALEASKKDVMAEINSYIDHYLEPSGVRVRSEWRRYLFTYDLFTAFMKAYPKASRKHLLNAVSESYTDPFYYLTDYENKKRKLKKSLKKSSRNVLSDDEFEEAFNEIEAKEKIVGIVQRQGSKKIKVKMETYDFFDEKIFKWNLDNAQSLINGGYKKFLFLE